MRAHLAIAAALLVVGAPVSDAYHILQHVNPSGSVVELSWPASDFPVSYFVNNRQPLDFSLQDAVDAVGRSFQAWENVETSQIAFQFSGTTSAKPFEFFDGHSTLGFTDDPDLATPGVLGATLQVIDIFSGDIVEADIFFSERFVWSVDPNGDPNAFDFEGTATHEIGHFLGLDHSHVGFMESDPDGGRSLVAGASVMYPFAFEPGDVTGRILTDDDEAGISAIYPSGSFTQLTGSIAGRITKGGGGVAFAHVVAFNPFTGQTIGAFADRSGSYEIRGLSPGPHTVRVNPITDPASPPDFGFPSFLTDLDYRDALFQAGRAEVISSRTTSGIDIEVQP